MSEQDSHRPRRIPVALAAVIAALALIPATGVAAAPAGAPEARVDPIRSEQAGRQPLVVPADAKAAGKREVTYRVRGDRLQAKRGQRIRGAARRIWRRFTALIPTEQRRHLKKFSVFKGGFAGAYVAPLRRNPSNWKLGVFKRLRPFEIDFVLVHEFGHLLTLKSGQVPPTGPGGNCVTYNPGEGCALPGSYLARYVREFWQDNGRLAEWRQAEKGGRRAQNQFYQRHKDEFVTSYAPAHPAEDIAESWAVFVVGPHREGNRVADEKVRFFERFPELVALRAQIRTANPDPTVLE